MRDLSEAMKNPAFRDMYRQEMARVLLGLYEELANGRILSKAREQFRPGDEVEIKVPQVGWVRAKVVELDKDQTIEDIIVEDDSYGARIHVVAYEPIIYSDELKREGFVPSFLVRPYQGNEAHPESGD